MTGRAFLGVTICPGQARATVDQADDIGRAGVAQEDVARQ